MKWPHFSSLMAPRLAHSLTPSPPPSFLPSPSSVFRPPLKCGRDESPWARPPTPNPPPAFPPPDGVAGELENFSSSSLSSILTHAAAVAAESVQAEPTPGANSQAVRRAESGNLYEIRLPSYPPYPLSSCSR